MHATEQEVLMTVATVAGGQITAHKLDAVAWGLLLVWIGVALLANLGWGIGLLGVGILILGKQVTRKYMALALEMSAVVVGALFIMGGVWQLLDVRVSLIPVICIVAGIAILASALSEDAND
jgi:hypothetical protein